MANRRVLLTNRRMCAFFLLLLYLSVTEETKFKKEHNGVIGMRRFLALRNGANNGVKIVKSNVTVAQQLRKGTNVAKFKTTPEKSDCTKTVSNEKSVIAKQSLQADKNSTEIKTNKRLPSNNVNATTVETRVDPSKTSIDVTSVKEQINSSLSTVGSSQAQLTPNTQAASETTLAQEVPPIGGLINNSSIASSMTQIVKNENPPLVNQTAPIEKNVYPSMNHSQTESLLQIQDDPVQNMLANLVASPLSTSQVKVVTKPKTPPPEFQFIQECGCRRKFYYGFNELLESRLNSSCSDEGTQYAPGQKVVSYSLPRYTSPGDYNRTGSYKAHILENLHRMRRFYPGYSMRLYTDLPLDSSYCRFLCQNIDLFWCDIRNSVGDQSKMLHSTWKFLPLGDPSVELFLSRDLSVFINDREAAVVDDWLKLNKTFHLMRDKRRVHNFAMMGGLWGARNDLLEGDEGDKMRTQIISISKTPRNKGYRFKNFDQDILSRVIFYPRKKDIVAYDSYHCKQWKKFTMVRPFPVRRNNTIVVVEGFTNGGKRTSTTAAIKKKIRSTKCPMECRPPYGKDWEYC